MQSSPSPSNPISTSLSTSSPSTVSSDLGILERERPIYSGRVNSDH